MNTDLLFLFGLLLWIILGTSWLKVNPFFVLLTASLIGIWGFSVPLADLLEILEKGFWGTIKKIGILILLGSWIGMTLEASGATMTLAHTLLKYLIRLPIHFVVGFIGYWVAIPVFCDAAFVVLNTLNERLSQASQTPKIGLTVALSTGLYATHVLVPPTPGPLAAAANFHLDTLFLLFLWGGVLAFLLMLAGAAYAYWIGGSSSIPKLVSQVTAFEINSTLPGLSWAIAPILLPILLMSLGNIPLPIGVFKSILVILSKPHWAMCAGGLIAWNLVVKETWNQQLTYVQKSIQQALPIVAITAMGGTLGNILQYVPLTTYLERLAMIDSLGIAIPFLLAAFLKTAQGSSTVAILTASAIVYPLLPLLELDSEMGKIWGILAIGTGAMTVSHANDSYFWIVSQVGGLEPRKALRTHTLATLIQGMLGFLLIWSCVQWMGK